LLIRTPDHFITYTGDLRLHGHNREETLAFCEKAKHTELLMMEGVSISFPEREPDPAQVAVVSEEDLVQHLVRLELENPNRQITFNGYPANVERFAKIIEKSPRTVVLEANMAALLLEVFGIEVRYYYAESGKIPELNPALEIPYDTLLKDKTDYLWQVVNQFDNLQEGSLYIHSDAQPLGDFDPQYRVFLDLLAKKDITFVRLACSGHAIPEDLDKIIALIEPQVLVPIHTLKPEKLENPYGERILPERGEQIVL
ncbi:MAG TPA: MBL fold metallo-hydrolase, partial [Enterococcus faecalis]|nr:MBL fold metallo-hydrolase [Enterococcus faecalis]